MMYLEKVLGALLRPEKNSVPVKVHLSSLQAPEAFS